MNTDAFLELRGIGKHFRTGTARQHVVKAVDGVSFSVGRGETLGLVGESGCGKTTLGRCLLQLVPPTTGEIFFRGEPILGVSGAAMKRLRRDMQIIFQDPYSSLNPRMTVGRIIASGLAIQGMGTPQERLDAARGLMDRVGLLPDHINRFPHEFSGGQRQRICIARALSVRPQLIVADEPVSALDVSIQAQIINLFVRLQKEHDLTYIFISHDLGVVRHMCDRIAVMYLGRIVELAPRDGFYRSQHHPYSRALLSAVPSATVGAKKRRIMMEGDVPSPLRIPPGCSFHTRCSRCRPRCTEEIPSLRDIAAGHSVACHFPLD